MKAFNDYEQTRAAVERATLPVGAYPIVIKAAEEKQYQGKNGSFCILEVSFDITDGEFKDFFAEDYRSQPVEDKKWKGVLRQFIPNDDGSEKDNQTKSFFKAMITAIEENNQGYHWDWNESGLKGKTAVCIFRNEEWDFNGRTGWKAQPFKFISMEQYEKGKYKLPNEKPLKNQTAASSRSLNDMAEALDDGDLPF